MEEKVVPEYSTKKNKSNTAAKEVMNIKKTKGITLKEAWEEYKNTKKE